MQEKEFNIEEIIEMIHNKQYKMLRDLLSNLNPADIAEIIETLVDDDEITDEQIPRMYRLLPKDLLYASNH